MITVEGKIHRLGRGTGTWTLVTRQGTTYEILKGAPKNLLRPDLSVCITGQIREDVISTAMIGSVLEVRSFELLKP